MFLTRKTITQSRVSGPEGAAKNQPERGALRLARVETAQDVPPCLATYHDPLGYPPEPLEALELRAPIRCFWVVFPVFHAVLRDLAFSRLWGLSVQQ